MKRLLSRYFHSEPLVAAPQEDGELMALKQELSAMARRLAVLEAEPAISVRAVNIRSGMNLNKRTQALRQYRLGRTSSEIARSLEMPKAEVDLLLKVHRICSNHEPRP